ncbi:MAG: bifunctional adenosylcobinamide kinase/adenosylcobinamide-phosphate guanylyltransferase [Prevotellaceae bacterium]|nr:bifunctional adenosylcobinamide kinase/adenosylcobinamide-phosphate guanylyltransferase [Prevotellaceae bacterium]
MKKIVLVTGGQRSGKSEYAEQLAMRLSPNPVYMATSRIWDEEFRHRVEIHKQRRGPQWTNIEEEKWLSRHDVSGRTVLVDCVTLWATNFFFDLQNECSHSAKAAGEHVERTLAALKEEFEKFTSQDATFIFVTNEIGSGGVSDNEIQRKFTDVEGWMNQYVASKADEVVMMVCGIAVKIK